ncbi:M1 family metallopeptidase [Sphingosinithalassobacter sp. LHW66-3]|uniref:M1 family metallopeptidase n=1 Tax=Sphingosinithalassobacter sp. LHW66-3 TaxID=3424718 RepID=UPI003D6C0C86
MRPLLLLSCAFLSLASAQAQTAPELPAAPAATEEALPTGRLPDTVTPTAYRLDFTILPESPTFSGHTEIDATLNAAARTIYIHGRDLEVERAMVTAGGQSYPVTFEQRNPFGLATVDFGRELPPGRITLTFDYEGKLQEDVPSGLYRVKVEDEWYSWTQFQSIDARSAFPGFDEPGYKTPFTVSIATAPDNLAVSNAPEVRSETEGNMVRHHFAPTPPLPTYLVALVTGPFVTAEAVIPPTPQRAEPLPLRIVGTKPNADRLRYALEETGPIVALLESYFDQAFPFPKLDQIGSPIMPGAMENAGADIYGDDILFVTEDSSKEDKQAFGMIVAHELSHQWFGDYATPAWWDDIWLNESFANWMGYRIGDEWRPELDIGTGALAEGFEAMELDSLTVGRPIHERVTSDADIDSTFDQITYGKGGQVVAMIAAYLGDEKFREGVRLHMERHPYGTAATDDFFDSLATAADDPRVLASLRSFVDQQGVPLVTLTRRDGGWTATQSPYAHLGTTPEPRQWIVPLCMQRGAATRECVLLDQPSVAIADVSGAGPLMPNAGGQGYYRFALPEAEWDALIAAAPSLSSGEAIALIDSLWAGFRAGNVPVEKLVAAARVLAHHPDAEIALDSGNRLAALEEDGLISEAALPAFRATVASIYRPLLDELGSDVRAGTYAEDNAARRDLRSALIELTADTGRDAELRESLTAAADAYLAGDTDALDPAMRGAAFRYAAADRGVPFAMQVAQRAMSSSDAAFQQMAMGALMQSGNPDVGRFLLGLLSNEAVPAGQRMFALYGLLGSAGTRDVAFDFLAENFETFSGGGGGIFFARAGQAFAGFCSAERATALEERVLPILEQAGGSLSLRRAIEQIRNCATFKQAKAEDVSAAFLAMQR